MLFLNNLKEQTIFRGITLLTEGSSTIGLGHIRRSVTLARILRVLAPTRIWVKSSSLTVESPLGQEFHGLTVKVGPWPEQPSQVEVLDLEPISMKMQLSRNCEGAMRLCLDLFDPEVLPEVTMNLIDHGGLMRLAYQAAGRESHYREGPECAIIRPSIRSLRPVAPLASHHVGRVVVTPGGADPGRQTLRAVADLAKNCPRDTEVTVIIGPLFPASYESEIRSEVPSTYRVVRDPKNFEAILASADLVVSSGGGTLLESMCLAKPTVVYPQTPEEENHALSHSRAGACVMWSTLPLALSSTELRAALAERAFQRVDGRGAERIAAAAMTLYSKTN